MASWILICKQCGEVIPYLRIKETLAEYFFLKQPEIPPERFECKCPICQGILIYQKHELEFQS
jgi:hypothetical protein